MRNILALSLLLAMLFVKTAVSAPCNFAAPNFSGADATRINRIITDYQNEINRLIAGFPGIDTALRTNACNAAIDNIGRADNVLQAQAAAAEARENELSRQNRTLTAATMAATGIGGMQLARGMAEQRADQHGADTMDAYLRSIRCGIGVNRNLTLGEQGTAPGRSAEFGDAVMEAVMLAQQISNARNHLGMHPGMEEDFLNMIDTSMLFTGRGSDTEGFANRFDTAQERLDSGAARDRMAAGGAMVGGGVAGGIAGNQMINHGRGNAGTVAAAAAGGGGLGAIAGGGGAGGLAGAARGFGNMLPSDRRLKENLTAVGTLENGLTIYSGNFRPDTGFDARPQLFLIAQEVMEVNPDAVTENADGYLMVDYYRATR